MDIKLFKMKNIIYYITFVMIISISCSKEGCTDSAAHNYDPTATKDDGKCFYGLNESAAEFTFEFFTLN